MVGTDGMQAQAALNPCNVNERALNPDDVQFQHPGMDARHLNFPFLSTH